MGKRRFEQPADRARRSPRITGLSSSRGSCPPSSRVHSTGTSVTAMTVAASTAKVFVNASGWKSLPSWPVSAKTGTKASRMIAIEKKTGRPTSRVDSSTASRPRDDRADRRSALLDEAEGVLGHDDAGIDQDADRDGDAGEAHDVRRDARVVHPEERQQHRQRQRNRDDQDRPEVHQEDDVRERHEDDLFDQRRAQRVDGLFDQVGAIVERHDAARRPGRPGLESARFVP